MAAIQTDINRDRTLHGVTPVLLTGSHVAYTTRGYLDATKNDRRLLTALFALRMQQFCQDVSGAGKRPRVVCALSARLAVRPEGGRAEADYKE